MNFLKNMFLVMMVSCGFFAEQNTWACEKSARSEFRNNTNKDMFIHEIQYHNRFNPEKWANRALPRILAGKTLTVDLCAAQIKKIYYAEFDRGGQGKMNILEGRWDIGTNFNFMLADNGTVQLGGIPRGVPYSIKVQNRTNKYVQIFIEYDVIPVKFLREICGKNDLFQLVPQGAKPHQIKNSLGEVTKTVNNEHVVSIGGCNVKNVRAEIFDGPEWSNKIATVNAGGTLSSSATYQVIFNPTTNQYQVKKD